MTTWSPAFIDATSDYVDAAVRVYAEKSTPTTPCTDGNPCGTIISYLGVSLAAANDNERPTWNANSGKPYLSFDGSNDALLSPASYSDLAAGAMWLAYSGSLPGNLQGAIGLAPAAPSNYQARAIARIFDQFRCNNYTDYGDTTFGTPSTTNHSFVARKSSASICNGSMDGGSEAAGTWMTPCVNTSSCKISLGVYAGGSWYLTGKIFRAAWGFGTLSAANRALLHIWLTAGIG